MFYADSTFVPHSTQFLLGIFAEGSTQSPREPVIYANFLSALFFTYVNPLIMTPYSTHMTVMSIVKQTAEYPNLLRNVMRNPNPTKSIT